MGLTRRGLLAGMAAGAAGSIWTAPANATVMRAMPLSALVQTSRRIVVVTALSAECHFEELGRRRRIVTDTRLRVEEGLAKADGMDSEILVRTLGGAVGDLGERVHGQAQLVLGEPCVAFLLQGPENLHYINGMAQGHYPLSRDARRLLQQSPDMPKIVDFDSSAVKALVGTELNSARSRVRAMVKP